MQHSISSVRPGARRPFASGMLGTGLLSLFFGLAIIVAPALLAYIVASFFVVAGMSLLIAWWSLR